MNDPDDERPGDLDIDAAFADIVSHWWDADSPVGGWPAEGDVGGRAGTGVDPSSHVVRPAGVRSGLPGGSADGGGSSTDAQQDEGAFIPPDPGPLPRGDLLARACWGTIIGVPALLVVLAVTWRALPGWGIVGAVIAFVLAFVVLVARMPDRRPEDDDPDHGAVV